jgi:hypothetical protein
MPSNYAGIEWKVTVAGVEYPVASQTVKVYDITGAAPSTGVGAVALPDLTTDVSGVMAAGTLATVAVGHTVRFSLRRTADGLARSFTQITT